jgi:hypothetical protein
VSDLVLRVIVDGERGLPPERRVRASLIHRDEVADVLGVHTSEAADRVANLDRGIPYSDVLGEERLYLLTASAIGGLTQLLPRMPSPTGARRRDRGADDLAVVVKEAFTATLRQRGAGIAADRLAVLDADQAWEAYFVPTVDRIEDTLAR